MIAQLKTSWERGTLLRLRRLIRPTPLRPRASRGSVAGSGTEGGGGSGHDAGKRERNRGVAPKGRRRAISESGVRENREPLISEPGLATTAGVTISAETPADQSTSGVKVKSPVLAVARVGDAVPCKGQTRK